MHKLVPSCLHLAVTGCLLTLGGTSRSHRRQPTHPAQATHGGTSEYCSSDYTPPDRLVVVSAAKYDVSWLDSLGLPYVAYQSSEPYGRHYHKDLANEAAAYLQFIIDYYACLPKVAAFIHGHKEESWHSADMAQQVLNQLQWESVTFTDINRKMPLWKVPVGNLTKHPPGKVLAEGAAAYNGSFHPLQVNFGKAYEAEHVRRWMDYGASARAWDKFFGRYGLGGMPDFVSYVCCAQFAVSRDKVMGRPHSFYQAAMNYMADNDIQQNMRYEKSHTIGDVFNQYWGVVFGEATDIRQKDECEVFRCQADSSRLMGRYTEPLIQLCDAWAGGYHPAGARGSWQQL